MKSLIIVLFLVIMACDEGEYTPPYPLDKIGCEYSAIHGAPDRQFVGCITFGEFIDKRDPKHAWLPVDTCDQCK